MVLRRKISLQRKAQEPIKEEKLYYPTMYISETQLPLDKDDVGKTLSAKIKLRVKGITQNFNIDKTRYNYDFEIMEIEFDEGKK